jgi:hypothetical protein
MMTFPIRLTGKCTAYGVFGRGSFLAATSTSFSRLEHFIFANDPIKVCTTFVSMKEMVKEPEYKQISEMKKNF